MFFIGVYNMSRGIDYGLGKTNIDTDTGIRFGVIPVNEVCQAWSDSSEGIYEFYCPHCNGYLLTNEDQTCEHCEKEIKEKDFWDTEPSCFVYENNGYRAHQSNDSSDIFIEKSPFYTVCEFCSPCAPGAGYILNSSEDGILAYCFGHDWFEDGKAPYKVYRVDNNEEVLPE
jgi:hypothetical protein